jgi:hypothetical protein
MAEVLNPANTEAPHKQQPKATSGGINIEFWLCSHFQPSAAPRPNAAVAAHSCR